MENAFSPLQTSHSVTGLQRSNIILDILCSIADNFTSSIWLL